ncbi:MAG: hypothetical protein QM784_07415 [Polyangiaceae bacterium]
MTDAPNGEDEVQWQTNDDVFAGDEEAFVIGRAVDLAATALGTVSSWCPSVQHGARLCLECETAIAL